MTCTGKENSCENFDFRTTCNSQIGCRYTAINSECGGTPLSCIDFSAKSSCDQQSGCSWDSSSSGSFLGILLGAIASACVLIGLAIFALLYFKGHFQTEIGLLEQMRRSTENPSLARESFDNEIVESISVYDAQDNVKHLTEITPSTNEGSRIIKIIERIDPDGSQTTETHREKSNGEIVVEIVSGKVDDLA